MKRLPPRSKRTDTRLPYRTLFRSDLAVARRDRAGRRTIDNGCLRTELAVVDPAVQLRGRAQGGVTEFQREYGRAQRSEEHTSELQSLMRISYAVFCLQKKNTAPKHDIRTLPIPKTVKRKRTH